MSPGPGRRLDREELPFEVQTQVNRYTYANEEKEIELPCIGENNRALGNIITAVDIRGGRCVRNGYKAW